MSESSDDIWNGKVNSVDLMLEQNTKEHHAPYEICEYDDDDIFWFEEKDLVVRRGQPFDIEIRLSEMIKEISDMKLEFCTVTAKNRTIKVDVNVGTKQEGDSIWCAWLVSRDRLTYTVRVIASPTCAVAPWKMRVEIKPSPDRDYYISYTIPEKIYILFNPWCKKDVVYMPDTKLLDEYVLNDRGVVFQGSSWRPRAKEWIFGQFEENILECVMEFLDQRLAVNKRGSAVHVARMLTAFANSNNGFGILTGNWSGDYEGGKSPSSWKSSVKIVREYFENKRSVNYGQCWVFSALLVTLCRTLGIPVRSVTNFSSAHDKDKSLTIDKYVDSDGNPIKWKSKDSTWNFHVWNEVWMARPDIINPSYQCDGWQAIDGTPQELSEGLYQCGPAPLVAIKNGDVDLGQDTGFVFAEVNADTITYVEDKKGHSKVSSIKSNRVGKNITTKKPNYKIDTEEYQWRYKCGERITDQYKHKEDSTEERLAVTNAVAKAAIKSSKPSVYDSTPTNILFELVEMPEDHEFKIGETVERVLKIENTSDNRRTIAGSILLECINYTKDVMKKVKEPIKFKWTLAGKEKKEVKLTSCYDDYKEVYRSTKGLGEQYLMRITATAVTVETSHAFLEEDIFELTKPSLKVTGNKEGKVGEKYEVTVSFENPLPEALTNISLEWDGTGFQEKKGGELVFQKEKIRPKKDGGSFTKTFTVTPRKDGDKEILVTFDSDELPEIEGKLKFKVEKRQNMQQKKTT